MKCAQCSSENLHEGVLASCGGVEFRPEHVRWLALASHLDVKAHACRDCGFVHVFVDPEKLAKMTTQPVEESK